MSDGTQSYQLLLNIQSPVSYVLLGVHSLLFGVQSYLFCVPFFRRN